MNKVPGVLTTLFRKAFENIVEKEEHVGKHSYQSFEGKKNHHWKRNTTRTLHVGTNTWPWGA